MVLQTELRAAARGKTQTVASWVLAFDFSLFERKEENCICKMASKFKPRRPVSPDCDSCGIEIEPGVKKERSLSQVDTRIKKGCVPLFFERASSQWWKPSFDSESLEDAFHRFTFGHNKRRLVRALNFVILAAVIWAIVFAVGQSWSLFAGDVCFLAAVSALLLFTFKCSNLYKRCATHVSLFASILLITITLALFGIRSDFSDVAHFCMCTMVIMLIYTMIHSLSLYVCILITVALSVVHEVLSAVLTSPRSYDARTIGCRLGLHICIHLIGIQIFFMAQVRERSTFWKVGQSVVARHDLEIEKGVKERMIRSVMPGIVADDLLKDEGDWKGPNEETGCGQIIFRPFRMHRMENVSILFADIVGFTKMSSNKSAEQLVGLLNDLFGRFDRLTETNHCEKISTLGDCYYCVAGCPIPTKRHAFNCVEMGLDMLEQIKEFCQDTGNDVDMRVGVHTGTVLCGIVGTKRFKFDVWSNDVSLANRMEAAGQPGRVHITEATLKFLNGFYLVEDGCGDMGIKTHFIIRRKNGMAKPDLSPDGTENENAVGSLDSGESKKKPKTSFFHRRADKKKKSKKSVKISDEVSSSDQICNSNSNVSASDAVFEISQIPKGNLKHTRGERLELNFFDTSTVPSEDDKNRPLLEGLPVDALGLSFNEALMQYNRKTSDKLLLNLMSSAQAGKEYFHQASVSCCTLQFTDPAIERHYQNEGQDCTLLNPSVTTLSSPRVNFGIDVLLSNIVYVILSVICFIVFDERPLSAVVLVSVATVIEFTLFISTFARAFPGLFPGCINHVAVHVSGWYMSHIIGALLMSLPMAMVFANFMDCKKLENSSSKDFYTLFVAVALLHFCNFTQLTSWMKSGLACVFTLTYVVLLNVDDFCTYSADVSKRTSQQQVMACIMLLLVFVCILNYQLEIGVRRNFNGDAKAAIAKETAEWHKQQATWLLESIFPKHVTEAMKHQVMYSNNHTNAGVLFASIVNFGEFYEENFEGGKECIRVLNELVGDFDDLLDKTEFSHVEKIKTVNGSTFMAGSGLNVEQSAYEDAEENEHLRQLLEFSLEMYKVVDKFNENMLGFKFLLRAGFNNGPLTSGVVGTTKLLYDIWGNTVNVASRMDSTGVAGRIQVSEAAKNSVDNFFTFEHRGVIPVKGKGNLTTYLLVGQKKVRFIY